VTTTSLTAASTIWQTERPVGRAQHFDADRKPVEDLTKNEVLGIARYEASVSKRNALACRKHLRDLIKWHGKGHL
jgi:hypothetical protein